MDNNVYASVPRQTVIVCFGTPSISGDALGPEVGSNLRLRRDLNAFVYGTLENPITGKNMHDWLDFIRQVHEGALFVAVDASLGDKSHIGKVLVRSDGVCPAAVGGRKSRFGDVGVLGVVGDKNGDALNELMQINSLYVSKMALELANLLAEGLKRYEKETERIMRDPMGAGAFGGF